MIDNLLMATNEELKEESRRLLNEFENEKSVIAMAYAKMMSYQKRFIEIDDIIKKREGES